MGWHAPAYAARAFTMTLVSPSPAQLDMGVVSTAVFSVTNKNTGTNGGESIYNVRFRINSGSTFNCGSTAAPSGWTIVSGSCTTTSVTFQANSLANSIPVNGTANFSIGILTRTTSADVTDNLRDVRSRYTATASPWPPSTSLGSVTDSPTTTNKTPSWTIKSLVMTLTSSSYSVGKGCPAAFTLTMQITNKSSASITGVTSSPKPPTVTATGGASVSTTSNPASLSLNAVGNSGSSGQLVWTYSTGASAGTITFSAYATDSTGTRTSRTITSSVITVINASCLTADFTTTPPSPSCGYSGNTVTFTMHVVNNTTGTLTAVTPSALTTGGTATFGAISGPSPASVASLAVGASTNFTWSVPITGSVYQTYWVSGYATASGGVQSQTVSSTSADINGFLLTVSQTNTTAPTAYSTNLEMQWQVLNYGCNNVNSVSIPISAGWTWNGDSYSYVNTGSGVFTEAWTAVLSGSNVIFTPPSSGTQMVVDPAALSYFSLTLTAPSVSSTTNYNFSATITDTASNAMTPSSTVTLYPYNYVTPGPNSTVPGNWREQFP